MTIFQVGINAIGTQQNPDTGGVAQTGSGAQSCIAIGIFQIDVAHTCCQQGFDALGVAGYGGIMEGRAVLEVSGVDQFVICSR